MCNFSFDPSLWPKEVHMFDEPWDCPYPAVTGEDFCIFHIHPLLREIKFNTQLKRDREYIKAVQAVGVLHVICTTVRRLNLEVLSRLTYRNDQIQIGYTKVVEDLNLSESSTEGYIVIEDCRINEVDFERSRLSSGLRIQRSRVNKLLLSETSIEGQASFIDCTFQQTQFIQTRFENTVSFCERIPDPTPLSDIDQYLGEDSCTFLDTATFMGAQFKKGAFFAGVDFKSGANFNEARFNKGGIFIQTRFNIGCHFDSAEFEGKTVFDEANLGKANFQKTVFQGPVRFNSASFGTDKVYTKGINLSRHCISEGFDQTELERCTNVLGDFVFGDGVSTVGEKAASFDNVEAHDLMELNGATSKGMITAFSSDIYFLEIDIEFDSSSPTITFYGSTIRGGILRISDERSFIELANTTVNDISLISNINESPLKNIYIENTTFEGFDFARHRNELREINWLIDGYFHEGKHKESRYPEGTYAKAKAGAQRVGDYYAESKFFIKEQRLRREAYWEEAKQGNNKLDSTKNLFYYLSNLSYDLLCKYAESSKRVVGWSILVVFLFAGVYRVLSVDLSYSASLVLPGFVPLRLEIPGVEYLIFSTESFTAFLLAGGPQITDPTVRILTSIQAFSGAFLIALFVATLIRSVKR